MANENKEGMVPEAEENVSGAAAEELHAGNSNNDAGTDGDGHEAGAEDRDFSDEEGEDGGAGAAGEDKGSQTEEGEKPEGKKPQTPEERAENARKRREQEHRDALNAAARKARVEAILEVTGGVNPWTKQPMKDAQDVEVYERMKRIEKAGGDPVTDYAAATAEDARQAEATRAQAEADAKWYRDDLAAFRSKYPDVNAEALLSDPDFNDYAAAQVKAKVPLAQIYGGYKRLEEKFSKAAADRAKDAEDRAAQALANARAGVGSKSGGEAMIGFISPEQARSMTPEEMKKNRELVEKSMSRWK